MQRLKLLASGASVESCRELLVGKTGMVRVGQATRGQSNGPLNRLRRGTTLNQRRKKTTFDCASSFPVQRPFHNLRLSRAQSVAATIEFRYGFATTKGLHRLPRYVQDGGAVRGLHAERSIVPRIKRCCINGRRIRLMVSGSRSFRGNRTCRPRGTANESAGAQMVS